MREIQWLSDDCTALPMATLFKSNDKCSHQFIQHAAKMIHHQTAFINTFNYSFFFLIIYKLEEQGKRRNKNTVSWMFDQIPFFLSLENQLEQGALWLVENKKKMKKNTSPFKMNRYWLRLLPPERWKRSPCGLLGYPSINIFFFSTSGDFFMSMFVG